MGQLVVGASCSGTLYAFDRDTGEVRWSYDTAGDQVQAQFHGDPVVVGDTLVIPSDARPAGYVYAFELETGAVRWKTPVSPGGVTSHLVRAGSSILGLTPTGRLMAFDLDTGAERWSVEAEAGPGMISLNTHPALAGDRVVYGAPDGRVRSVDVSSGEVLWATELSARPSTAAVVDGEHLLIGAVDNSLVRLALADGRVTARLELPSSAIGTPTLAGDALVLVGAAGYLGVVDRELTGISWSYTAPEGWSSFQPLVEGGRVVAGTDDGVLFAFDLESGAVLWQEKLAGTLRGIGHAAGTYFIGTLQGMLYAWSPGLETVAGAPDPLSWLVGSWRGAKGDAVIEETWSRREGDNRMGMFRLVADGTVRFYEFMSIEYDGDEPPVLRIKHFDKGLRGWEEREESVTFRLAEADARRAVFEEIDPEVPTRLVYTLEGDGGMLLALEKDRPEGATRSEFRYTTRE